MSDLWGSKWKKNMTGTCLLSTCATLPLCAMPACQYFLLRPYLLALFLYFSTSSDNVQRYFSRYYGELSARRRTTRKGIMLSSTQLAIAICDVALNANLSCIDIFLWNVMVDTLDPISLTNKKVSHTSVLSLFNKTEKRLTKISLYIKFMIKI